MHTCNHSLRRLKLEDLEFQASQDRDPIFKTKTKTEMVEERSRV